MPKVERPTLIQQRLNRASVWGRNWDGLQLAFQKPALVSMVDPLLASPKYLQSDAVIRKWKHTGVNRTA
jgi:hypothetical protein